MIKNNLKKVIIINYPLLKMPKRVFSNLLALIWIHLYLVQFKKVRVYSRQIKKILIFRSKIYKILKIIKKIPIRPKQLKLQKIFLNLDCFRIKPPVNKMVKRIKKFLLDYSAHNNLNKHPLDLVKITIIGQLLNRKKTIFYKLEQIWKTKVLDSLFKTSHSLVNPFLAKIIQDKAYSVNLHSDKTVWVIQLLDNRVSGKLALVKLILRKTKKNKDKFKPNLEHLDFLPRINKHNKICRLFKTNPYLEEDKLNQTWLLIVCLIKATFYNNLETKTKIKVKVNNRFNKIKKEDRWAFFSFESDL